MFDPSNGVVDQAVWRAGYGAVTDAVNGVSRRAGDGALDVVIDEVMAAAVVHTVWRAVKDDPTHLALQDFLYEARG